MHDQYREQRPLLCDDLTDEELNPNYHRSYRHISRGRTKAQIKGAAVIISNWPDYWISSVSRWWMALGMFALTVFIVYNSVLAFSILPQVQTKPTKMKAINKFASMRDINSKKHLPEVFIHTMIESNEPIENKYKKYAPLIDPITYKYPEFKYNLYVIHNDTNTSSKNDYQNNEIALYSLWNKPIKRNNIMIHSVMLSHLMYKSPVMKNWQDLPKHFMDFLIRAVLIWDKGGIALSPQVFTSPADYNDVVDNVFKTYLNLNGTKTEKRNKKLDAEKKKTVNNIQDIIDMLDHEYDNDSSYSPTEAENRNIVTATHSSRHLLSAETSHPNENYPTKDNEVYSNSKLVFPILSHPNTNKSLSTINGDILSSPEYNKTNLLPLFLQYLFHDKNEINIHEIDKKNTTNNSRQRKSTDEVNNVKTSQISESNKTKALKNLKSNDKKDIKPMIVRAKETKYDIIPKKAEVKDITSSFNIDNLIIDIKGNILATRTSCHAFLGTLFQSAAHHLDSTESLSNFLITELTHFCKGLLSTCRGIDVILI